MIRRKRYTEKRERRGKSPQNAIFKEFPKTKHHNRKRSVSKPKSGRFLSANGICTYRNAKKASIRADPTVF